jgi:hypothetical protein
VDGSILGRLDMPSNPWWFVNWFVNGLVNWFVNGLVNWFVNGLVNWFVNGLSDWFVNWLVNWFDRPPVCGLSATAGGARDNVAPAGGAVVESGGAMGGTRTAGAAHDNAAPAGGTGMVGGCRAGCRAGCRVGCRSGCREGDEVLDTSAVQGEGGLCGRPRESFPAPTSNAEDAAALSSPCIWETRLSYRAFSLAGTR